MAQVRIRLRKNVGFGNSANVFGLEVTTDWQTMDESAVPKAAFDSSAVEIEKLETPPQKEEK